MTAEQRPRKETAVAPSRTEEACRARSCGHGEGLILAGFLGLGTETLRAELCQRGIPKLWVSRGSPNPPDAAVEEPCESWRSPLFEGGKRSRRLP